MTGTVEKKHYLILPLLTTGMIYFASGGSGGPAGPENMGYPINTRGDDFCPSFTGDGSIMVFSSREKGEGDHNVFMCAREGSSWSRPMPIREINTGHNEETPFIASDGTVLLFASDRPETRMPSVTADNVERITFDIYYSKKTENGWTDPLPVPGDVNTTQNERAPALSRDKKVLYYTRWPYRNLQKALLMSAVMEGDIFTASEEFPAPLNTGNYEMGVRPDPDGHGFYFSSMRPGGYGGWDIYFVPYKNGMFGAARNLGPEINSRENDLFFAKTQSGYYFCSNRSGSLGRYDLYAGLTGAVPEKKELFSRSGPVDEKKSLAEMVPQEEGIRTAPAGKKGKTRITFTIIDEITGRPLSMRFRVYLKNSSDPESPALRFVIKQSDSAGRFSILPKSDVTHIMVRPEEDGAIAMQSVRVEPRREKQVSIVIGRPQGRDAMTAPPPERGDVMDEAPARPRSESAGSMQNILFDTNSVNIRLEYYPFIHNLINHLRGNPSARLLITGHADRRGTEDANEQLSLNRAAEVRDYLVRMGIGQDRLTIRGMGDRHPLVRDGYAAQANRRVEFKIH